MSDQPLVSILTPSFNQARWLGDCLQSVACQSYSNIEHIVMDGGSTDGSVEVLEHADPPVTWRSEPDRGQPHAVNKAFAESSGEIIGWINSDDALYDAEVVSDVVEHFAMHPEADVVYGHGAKITADGKVVYVIRVKPFTQELNKILCPLIQPAVFIRRSALEDGFLDESFQYAMDWELWLRLATTRRFEMIDRVVAVDRLQPQRKMKTWTPVLIENRERLAQMYGVHRPEEIDRIEKRWHRYTRVMGWKHALARPEQLAFSGAQDSRLALFTRQLLIPPRFWPAEYK